MSTDPAQEFASWWHDQTCPASDVEPLPDTEAEAALSRLPAPNHAQGSSGNADPPRSDPAQQFADHLAEGLARGRLR